MNIEEIKNFVIQYIEDDGYQDYTITIISHAEGTNVWSIEVEIPEGKIEMMIDDDTGKLLRKLRHKNIVINETVEYTEEVIVAGELIFELKEKIYLGGAFVDNTNIKLIQDEENKDYLKGFRITISDFDEGSIQDAIELSNRLTNYLSLQTGLVVEHKRPIIKEFKNEKTTTSITHTMDAILAKKQDLDLTKLKDFLSKDERTHQHTFQFKKGLESIQNNDFPNAIRWFFMIIENDKTANSAKYFPIRNVISHEELDRNNTINGVKVFGITMKKGEHLNFNNPEIYKILKTEAHNLLNIVRPIVEKEVKNNIK